MIFRTRGAAPLLAILLAGAAGCSDAPRTSPSPPPAVGLDSDGDGISDAAERKAGTNPNVPDAPALGFEIFTPMRDR